MKMDELKNHPNTDLDEIERLKDEVNNSNYDKAINQMSEILKALGDPIRIQILYLLKSRNLSVSEIMNALGKPQNTISYHIKVLENSGLIEGHREGILIIYSLKKPEIIDLLDSTLKPSKG
mgnify:CR=1 FL=1